MSRLISPTHVRRYLLDAAARTRHHKFKRVSQDTLDLIEGAVREHCVRIVTQAPSKGATL
ncbi:MAG: hypothetical protein ABMA13_23060 [Chthoniobacteraceae bacterium]